MEGNNLQIEERLRNMKKIYIKVGELLDKLPDGFSEKTKKNIKDAILGDTELKTLMDGIDYNRPPKIFLMGRTGVGKSSLINALCGAYVAQVSDIKSCTYTSNSYEIKDGDRLLMEILDTRGIAESVTLNNSISAEDMLLNQINEFTPDVAVFMLNCMHRDDVNSDIEFLKKVAKSYGDINKCTLPIVVVINKCDEMTPARYKDPSQYPQRKIDNIKEVAHYYKGIIMSSGLKVNDIISVSSLIDWQTPDGTEVDAETINSLPVNDIENLTIAFDGRYGIQELYNILEKAILDSEAKAGLRMAARLTEVVERIATQLVKIFSGISATIALTPIPVSDIYLLLILQCFLVALIASLSGREISLETAKEFILSLGGIAGTGFMFRIVAQQAAKFINVVWPAAGSAVSSGIAATGTSAIGKAAIAYYINNINFDMVKEKFIFTKKQTSSQ